MNRKRAREKVFHYTSKGRRDIGRPRKRWEAEPGTGRLPMALMKLSGSIQRGFKVQHYEGRK